MLSALFVNEKKKVEKYVSLKSGRESEMAQSAFSAQHGESFHFP